MSFFTADELDAITKAATDRGLMGAQRTALSAGIPPAWWFQIPDGGNPLGQLVVDLSQLNETTLADGSIPFDVWLRNAARLTALTAEQSIFLSSQAKLRERAMGGPPIPWADALPEHGQKLVMPERQIFEDDRVPYGWLQGGVRTGASVLKLVVPRIENGKRVVSGGRAIEAAGTGWVLAPGVVATCRHVIEARGWGEGKPSLADLQAQVLAAEAWVGFDSDTAVAARVGVGALLFESSAIDLALLELKAPSPALDPLSLRESPLEVEDPSERVAVNIIQHPNGLPKRLGFRNNLVTSADASALRYVTDTDTGSSGSPVCDDQWRVVGVHRASEQTTSIKLGDRETTFVNVGTPITKVIAALRAEAALWARLEPGLRLEP
ncbi:MAG: trypsin-like peptidase domain-containing protein [Sandaracinaceae bacterium]|nr:trypsin-like peptidase domain-containing protein [Sandaracinaceae bacterium]